MRLSQLAFSTEEVEGVWVPYMYGADGKPELEVKLRALGNPRYTERLTKSLRRFRGADKETLAVKDAVAHEVVADVRGLTDEDDAPVAYSGEAFFKIFCDPMYGAFYTWVLNTAGSLRSQIEEMENAAGN